MNPPGPWYQAGTTAVVIVAAIVGAGTLWVTLQAIGRGLAALADLASDWPLVHPEAPGERPRQDDDDDVPDGAEYLRDRGPEETPEELGRAFLEPGAFEDFDGLSTD